MASGSEPLKERLAQEMKEALRARERVRLGALRLLSASVKNREVELRRELSADEFVEVVSREVKRRNEALEAYEKAGRDDLVAKETEEREVLTRYLPQQLSDEEVRALVDDAIRETGSSTPKDMGKVMGFVMRRAKGRVDGGKVQALVREKLG